MGALLINFSEDYTIGRSTKDFVNNISDFFLGNFFCQRKKEVFFETAETNFRKYRSQMSGNPV
jgi:hypothetical protein